METKKHNEQNPLFKRLFESHGAVGLKVPTKEVRHIRSGMYRRAYKVVLVQKGKRVSIINVLSR